MVPSCREQVRLILVSRIDCVSAGITPEAPYLRTTNGSDRSFGRTDQSRVRIGLLLSQLPKRTQSALFSVIINLVVFD